MPKAKSLFTKVAVLCLALLATFMVALPVVAYADDTDAATITYSDGSASEGWNGAGKTISKDCTITINRDFTQNGMLQLNKSGAKVIINGNGHTITVGTTSNAYQFGPSSVTVNNLTIQRSNGASTNLLTVSGNTVFNNVNVSNTSNVTVTLYGNSLEINGGSISSTATTTTIWDKTGNSTVTLNSGSITGVNQALNGSTLTYIQNGGSVNLTAGSSNTPAILAKNIYINGGSVTGTNKKSIGAYAFKLQMTGGSLSNLNRAVYVVSGAECAIADSAAFSNNTVDFFLAAADSRITIPKTGDKYTDAAGTEKTAAAWSGSATAYLSQTIADNTRYQVTSGTTSSAYASQLTPYNSNMTSGYSGSGDSDGYVYFVRHIHDWAYAARGNKITATCSVESDPCEYSTTPLELTLSAEDAEYSGSAYAGAFVDNGISSVITSGITVSDITYEGRGSTTYASSTTAPTEAGTYTAKVTLSYGDSSSVTAFADFAITAKAKEVVAEVTDGDGNTTSYESLEDALAAAGDGATVTLKKDVTLDKTAAVSKSITLDLGTKTLTAPSGAAALSVADSKTVTVKNGTVSGSLEAGKSATLTVDGAKTGDITAGEGSTVAAKNNATIGSVKASDSSADEVVDNGDGTYTVRKKETPSPEPVTPDPDPATPNPTPSTSDPDPTTSDPTPATPEPSTPDSDGDSDNKDNGNKNTNPVTPDSGSQKKSAKKALPQTGDAAQFAAGTSVLAAAFGATLLIVARKLRS